MATDDPFTSKVKRLTPVGFNSLRGLNTHGMDVDPLFTNPTELFIYLVNHRPPLVGDSSLRSDESIEVFITTAGGSDDVHTFEDSSVMLSINDVVGSDTNGNGVYFTNDGGLVSSVSTAFHCLYEQY